MPKKKKKQIISKKKTLLIGLTAAFILGVIGIVGFNMFASTAPNLQHGVKAGDKIKVTMKVGTGGDVKRLDGTNNGKKVIGITQLYCKEGSKGLCIDYSTADETHTLRYQAIPKTCYKFSEWKFGNGSVSKNNPVVVKRNGSHVITAIFKPNTSSNSHCPSWGDPVH